jgi:hypothetical protein
LGEEKPPAREKWKSAAKIAAEFDQKNSWPRVQASA